MDLVSYPARAEGLVNSINLCRLFNAKSIFMQAWVHSFIVKNISILSYSV